MNLPQAEFRPINEDEFEIVKKICKRKFKINILPKNVLVKYDGDFTIIYAYMMHLMCIGYAKCSRQDDFRELAGFAMAFRRLLEVPQICNTTAMDGEISFIKKTR